MTSAPTVFVVGHRGMLGHVVDRALSELGWQVRTSEERYDGTLGAPLVEAVRKSGCRLVVNCARARDESVSSPEMLPVNSVLPLHLAATIGEEGLLVHPSTDAVFRQGSQRRGIEDAPDADHGYGLSKRLGEGCAAFCPTVTLRCSVIGPELGAPRSLLARAFAHVGPMPGYLDHRWNGITTLEWARFAHEALQGRLPPGIHHPACEPSVTKFELLTAVSEVFGTPSEVRPVESGRPYDGVLEPTISLGPIREQLAVLHCWYEKSEHARAPDDHPGPPPAPAPFGSVRPPGPDDR